MTRRTNPDSPASPPLGSDHELTIDEILQVLWKGKGVLLLSALVLGAAGGVYAYLTPSVYSSRLYLRISGTPSAGQQANPSSSNRALGLLELGAVHQASYTAINTTLHSHDLLSRVVRQYHLNLAVRPIYSNWRSRMLALLSRSRPIVHFAQFQAQPSVIGQGLTLVADGNGRYHFILDSSGKTLVRGLVGMPTSAAAGAAGSNLSVASKGNAAGTTAQQKPLSLNISELRAKPGQRLQLSVNPVEATAQALASRLTVSQVGNSSSDVISVSLQGRDRKRLATILNAMVHAYVQQSLVWHSEQLSEQLHFIKGQLPDLRKNVVNAQSLYNSFRTKYGIVTINANTRALLTQAADYASKTAALQVKAAGLRQQLGPNSTRLKTLLAEISSFKQQRRTIEKQIAELPGKEQQLAQLQLTLKSASDLYNSMLSAAQELGIAKAGVVSDVRIIETAATSDLPISPHRSRVVAISVFLGLLIGGGWLIARFFMRPEDTNPERIRRMLGLSLAAIVPHAKKRRGNKPLVFGVVNREHPALEALRNLRTELGLSHPSGANLLITSAGLGDGKSTVALNLAWLLPETGGRVLLIDGDLRQGKLSDATGLDGRPGLAEVLLGEVKINDAVRPWRKGLDLLPAGRSAYRPADLLVRPLLGRLLKGLRERDLYDWIIVDSPPASDLTDAVLLGSHCDSIYLVYRSGSNRLRAFRSLIERLRDYGLPLDGLIVNDDPGALETTDGYFVRNPQTMRR